MTRKAQSGVVVRSSVLGSMVLVGAISTWVGCGGGGGGGDNTHQDTAVKDTAVAKDTPATTDTAPTPNPDSSPDLAADVPPVSDLPPRLDSGAGGAGGTDALGTGGNTNLDGGTGGAFADVLPDRPQDTPDAPGPDVMNHIDSMGTGEAGSVGGCPVAIGAWAYAVSPLSTVAWSADGSILTGGYFYKATEEFGGKKITNGGSADMLLAKLNSTTGAASWVFTAGDDKDQYTSHIAVVGGNVLVSGFFTGTLDVDPVNAVIPPIINPSDSNGLDFVAAFNDTDGTPIWSKKIDLGAISANPYIRSIAANPSKDYFLLCGAAAKKPSSLNPTGTAGGGLDVLVAALKVSDGSVVWAKMFGGAADQSCQAAGLDDNGNAYLAGTYAGTLDFGTGALAPAPSGAQDKAIWVAKLNGADGTVVAAKSFGPSSGIAHATSLALDPQGNVVVAGDFNIPLIFGSTSLTPVGTGTHNDSFVVKLDPSLAPLWARGFGGEAGDTASLSSAVGLATDSSGDITVVGNFQSSLNAGTGLPILKIGTTGPVQIYVLSLKGATGEALCARHFGDSAGKLSSSALGAAINKNHIAICGGFNTQIDFGDQTSPLTIDPSMVVTSTESYVLELAR